MQVHNHAAGQTVFAINNWRAGAAADIGIGNSPGDTRDWTFSGSSRAWSSKRLRVFVRPQKP
jgi:sialate O-acetylesterase